MVVPDVAPDTAAEREKGNPKCIECDMVTTNHFCTFVLDTGEKCGAPVCSICKWELFQKEFQDPTRCSKHSFTYDCPSATEPSPVANSELPPGASAVSSRKSPRKRTSVDSSKPPAKASTVTKKPKVQQICSMCQKNPTPKTCMYKRIDLAKCIYEPCEKPVCTSCKNAIYGPMGKYLCSEHAGSSATIASNNNKDVATAKKRTLKKQSKKNTPPTRSAPPTRTSPRRIPPSAAAPSSSDEDGDSKLYDPTPYSESVARGNSSRRGMSSTASVGSHASSEAAEVTKLPPPAAKTINRRASKKATTAAQRKSLLISGTDALLHKIVAFDLASEVGKEIASQLKCTVSRSSLQSNHLVGTVTRRGTQKGANGQLIYEVAWNSSQYGVTQMSHSHVYGGIEAYNKLEVQRMSLVGATNSSHARLRDPYNDAGVDVMIQRSRLEDPELSPCSSESDEDSSEGEGAIDDAIDRMFSQLSHTDRASATAPFFVDEDPLLLSEEEDDEDPMNVDEITGLDWKTGTTIGPKDFKSLPRATTIMPQFNSKYFDTPCSSFFSFLPVAMWEKITYESNTYAHEKIRTSKKRHVAGYYWRQDISLQEMMQFMGLLLQMTLQPIPGRDFRYYWSERTIFPWVECMPIHRFKQIRSVLHFNTSNRENKSTDPLHKVRPVYATIQETMGRYVDLGSEFSLDEASAACRSSFGRHLIVFNPMKNCGKFHFRFYLLCCSVSYVCVKLRIHVRTDEMDEQDKFVLETVPSEDGTQEPASTKVLNQLILDMARPLYGKGITLNFNNYYASPAIAIALLKHKVLCRGTLRRNKKLIPPYILFTKAEAKSRDSRGSVKVAVNEKYGLVAAGWIDNCAVHIISSADTTDLTQVSRRVGGVKTLVQAPEVIKKYNSGMDGVDRHDQYRSLISLCARHRFKKYYVKLILALVDMALTNANLHFMLRWKGTTDPRSTLSRADFFKEIAEKLMSHDRKWVREAGYIGLEAITGSSHIPDSLLPTLLVPRMDIIDQCGGTDHQLCVFDALEKYDNLFSKAVKKCQICDFEKRGNNRYKNVLICRVHGIRACGIARPPRSLEKNALVVKGTNDPVTDLSWMCPDDKGLTCMEKAHQFYFEHKVFKYRPVSIRDGAKVKFATIVLTSEMYKKRQEAMGLSFGTRGKKKKVTAKSNNNSTTRKQTDLEGNEESDNEEHSESSLSSSTGGLKKKEITKSKKKSKKKGATKSKKRSTATKQTISDEYVEPDEGYHSDNSWSTYNRVGV